MKSSVDGVGEAGSSSRSVLLVPLLLGALAGTGCGPGTNPGPRGPADLQVVTEFEVFVNPGTGALTFLQPGDDGSLQQGLSEIPVGVTGNPSTGVPETVKLVTPVAPVYDTDGTACGAADRYCGTVNMVSYFTTQKLENTYVQIVSIDPPTGRDSYNSDPSYMGLDATLGLWSYGTLIPNQTQPHVWGFNLPDAQNFRFRGKVWADLSPYP